MVMINKYSSAVELRDGQIYCYDMIPYCDVIDYESEGILTQCSYEYSQDIEKALKIKSVTEYGVAIIFEESIIIDESCFS